MLNDVLNFLKDQLNSYFKLKTGTMDEKVSFIDGKKTDPITFPLEMITPILINIEEDRIMRRPDMYCTINNIGEKVRSQRDIRMNLFILFVSRFTNYDQAMQYLSLVVKFFQHNVIFDHQNSPSLSDDIVKLIMELTALPLQQQDAIWNALRTAYLPSVLYKVKMVIFKDEPLTITNETQSPDYEISKI